MIPSVSDNQELRENEQFQTPLDRLLPNAVDVFVVVLVMLIVVSAEKRKTDDRVIRFPSAGRAQCPCVDHGGRNNECSYCAERKRENVQLVVG